MTLQQSPYLREQRQFPDENMGELSAQVDQSYIDIAQKVNSRTIGTFALGAQIVTGERWFLTGSSNARQRLRQLYQFSGAGNIAHGLNLTQVTGITIKDGTFTDGTNWYPLPYVSTVAAANQVSVTVDPTNIIITSGGAAPTIQSGYIVLEWMGN